MSNNSDVDVVRFADFLVGLSTDGDRKLFTRGLPAGLRKEVLELMPERRVLLRSREDKDLLDTQIELLLERMREKSLVQALAAQVQTVFSCAAGLEPNPATFLRFLPVIPLLQLTAISQMALIEWGGKQGIISRGIPPHAFLDPVETPENAYYVYDVRFVKLNEVDTEEFEYLGISEMMGLCVHADLNKLPWDADGLYALKPIVAGTEIVPSIYIGRGGVVPKLDLIARDAIASDALVPVKRRF